MASLGDPRYGVSVVIRSSNDEKKTRSFNYVNLAIGGSSSGYNVDDTLEFLEAVADVTGGSYVSSAITSQMIINETE